MSRRSLKWLTVFTILLTAGALASFAFSAERPAPAPVHRAV
ncbi:MAG: hypothetical protein P4L72_08380 [Parvibaculum sp.]|jgi:hypothetical protein|nr:hypothetical protein [Parvibaculum sp.]MDR3499228.1 hypothetical protein [Parvibaculum sp.]